MNIAEIILQRESPFRPVGRSHARKAFTLVELLVVIAIISILAALLMPSLRSARDRAKETACLSNMKQIYTALVMYGNDNEGFLPNGYSFQERTWYGWSFNGFPWSPAGFIHMKLQSYVPARSLVWLDPGWPADKSYNENATCAGTPDNPGAGNVAYSPRNLGGSYHYICYSSAYWGAGWTPEDIRFERPKNPAAAKIMACFPWQQGPEHGLVGPHRGGKSWNILWLDGHISTSRGIYASPPEGEPAVNSAGLWTP